MGSVRRRAVARGRVQGVFFRDATRREAERLGVAGSARNTVEGTVDCVFEGPAEAVEAMLAFVRSGPGQATVTSVAVTEEEVAGLKGFQTA